MSGIDNDTSCSECQLQPESWFEVSASNGECDGTTFKFDLEVEAWISPGCGKGVVALSLSGSSLILSDASAFPSSGEGYLFEGSPTDFTWTGKSGNTLTGTDLSSAKPGTQCSFYPQINTGYSGSPSITVSVATKSPGGSEVTVSPTQVSSWTDGVSDTEISVTNNPYEEDVSMDITVGETAEGSTGKSGSDSITLMPCTAPTQCSDFGAGCINLGGGQGTGSTPAAAQADAEAQCNSGWLCVGLTPNLCGCIYQDPVQLGQDWWGVGYTMCCKA